MPESVAGLPAVLRSHLSTTEQAVLTVGAAGGPERVFRDVSGVDSREQAKTMLDTVRAKAARLLDAQRSKNGRGPGEAACARHGAYTDRGRGCPVCNVGEGGGARPRPASSSQSRRELPALPPSEPRRPKRRSREEQRERAARGEREALRRKALEAAGVEEETIASPVPSEQDGTLRGEATPAEQVAVDSAAPPTAPPEAAASQFEELPADPAPATDGASRDDVPSVRHQSDDDSPDGPPFEVREPTPEERAAREAQVGAIEEAARAQEEESRATSPWPMPNDRTARGRSVEEQLRERRAPASRAEMERRCARVIAELRRGPKSQQAIRLAFGLERGSCAAMLKRMVAEGDIERTGRNVRDWPGAADERGRASPEFRIAPGAQVEFEEALIAGDAEVADARHGHNVRWTKEKMIEAGRAAMLRRGRELKWSDLQGVKRTRELPSGEAVRATFGGVPAFIAACFAGWELPEGVQIVRRDPDAPHGRVECAFCREEFVRPAPNAKVCAKPECRRAQRAEKSRRHHALAREAMAEKREREERGDVDAGAERVAEGAAGAVEEPGGAPGEPAASGGDGRTDAGRAAAERDEDAPAPALTSWQEEQLAKVRRGIAEGDRERRRIAVELYDIVADAAEQLDGAVPETLLRARYLAALLRRIEHGDTSPELLDRFERLAGLVEG